MQDFEKNIPVNIPFSIFCRVDGNLVQHIVLFKSFEIFWLFKEQCAIDLFLLRNTCD